MRIRNNDELKLFEKMLDCCDASVLVVTPQGDQYDLADPVQRVLGIAEMLCACEEYEEPELFASSSADEMIIFDYLNTI